MKKLLPVFVASAVVFACSTAWAGWAYVARAPRVVYRPVVPVVTYYAPVVPVAAVPVAPAPVVAASPVVVPAPVAVPTPVLTPSALVYPGAVFYPAPAVRARVYYRPARAVYGVIVP